MTKLQATNARAEQPVAHLLDAMSEPYCGAKRTRFSRESEMVDSTDDAPFGSEWCSTCWAMDDRPTAS